MAIVKMCRFELMAMEADRPLLFKGFQLMGSVQIDPPETAANWSQIEPLVHMVQGDLPQIHENLSILSRALDVLSLHGAIRRPFLAPRPGVSVRELMQEDAVPQALDSAQMIIEKEAQCKALLEQRVTLEAVLAALEPWKGLDVPLNLAPSPRLELYWGCVPPITKWPELTAAVAEAAPMTQLFKAEKTRQGLFFLCALHVSEKEALRQALHPFQPAQVTVPEYDGTAQAYAAEISAQLAKIRTEQDALVKELAGMNDRQALLELAHDQLTSLATREEAVERLVATEKTFTLTGWVPEEDTALLDNALARFDCMVKYEQPGREEDVPVLLKNHPLIQPLNFVTEMYSLPKYTGIDPNPLMAPFMILFFGMMYADIGYGLILILAGLLIQKKKRPVGPSSYIWRLLPLAGAASVFWGCIFGFSFFGDSLSVILRTFFSLEFTPPTLLNPTEDAVTLILLSLALGVVQVIFGMGIKAYMLIRDGKVWDAVMDIGSWWLVFAGVAVLALGGTYWVMVAGFVAVAATAGRHAPKLMGKVIGGLGKLYDITAYASDILSYLRLMALALAGGVIANVFNLLAALGGRTWYGAIMFGVIFLVGHAFNMAINIIGTYVHAARLQFMEFFGKFYEDGGRPFAPLTLKTKYVDITKEDK